MSDFQMRRWRRAGRALRTVGIIAKAGQSDLSRFFHDHVSSLLLGIPIPNASSAAATLIAVQGLLRPRGPRREFAP